jgi:glycosyltransferase involved in cell wall biosynthesis
MPRILITTNHLREIRGSELVTLELAEEFLQRGWHVDVYTNLFLPPMADRFAALEGTGRGTLRVADDPYDDFGLDYDLIWIQHSLLPPSVIRRLAERESRAAVVWHHMSALIEMELPILADIEVELSDLETYVSPRTLELQQRFGITGPSLIFANPVPRRFTEFDHTAAEVVKRIAVVSNHPPREVLEAAGLLAAGGIEVDVIGEATRVHEITPELLREYDAIVTIGKTVQYALCVGIPVYVYDHFGGDGWLTGENFAAESRTNFSGRATMRQLDAETVAAELVEGYAAARLFAMDRRAEHREAFSVRRRIDAVLEHPSVADPAAKRLSEAQSLRWLALSEQLRGMYRSIEFLKDELARVEAAVALSPDVPTTSTPLPSVSTSAADHVAPGSVHIFLATSGEPSAEARARASVAQQRLRPDRLTSPAQPRVEADAVAELGSARSIERFNELVAGVDTEFIAIQDGGGSWHPDFLAIAVDHLGRHPEQSAVVAATALTIERVVNGHRVEFEHHPMRPAARRVHDTIDVSDQLVANHTPFVAMVFRRAAAVAAGLLDNDLRYAMDWDFGLRLLHVGPIGILDSTSALVTVHADELDSTTSDDARRARTELAAKAMRIDGARHLMYSALLTSQAAAANMAGSTTLTGRFDELSHALRAHGDHRIEGLELRIRRYLRRLPTRVARRLPIGRGSRG